MNLTKLEDALSLAAVVRCETERKRWLRTYRHLHEHQKALTQAYYDAESSRALTQSLADAACAEVAAATRRNMP